MDVSILPSVRPIRLNPNVMDLGPTEDRCKQLNVVINIFYGNCIRVRAAVLLLQRVNELLPPAPCYADETALDYAQAMIDALSLKEPWRRMAARDAVFGIDNFRFLIELLLKRSSEFGLNNEGPAIIIIKEIHMEFNKMFPNAKDVRDAAAHTDQIYREARANPFTSSIASLNAIARDGASLLITDSMNDDTYITMKDGKYLNFPVTGVSFQNLHKIFESLAQILEG